MRLIEEIEEKINELDNKAIKPTAILMTKKSMLRLVVEERERTQYMATGYPDSMFGLKILYCLGEGDGSSGWLLLTDKLIDTMH